jgi:hypothetical protein
MLFKYHQPTGWRSVTATNNAPVGNARNAHTGKGLSLCHGLVAVKDSAGLGWWYLKSTTRSGPVTPEGWGTGPAE